MPSPTPRIIIAVDFGTTFSSVAYVYTKTFHPETKLIQKWPQGYGTVGWVPTTIKYEPPQWGYEIEDEDQQRYEWFKLGLAPLGLFKSSLMEQFPSRTALPYSVGTECEKLVTDYLCNIRKHAEQHIKKQLTETVWKNNGPPHYIITVPAVWDPKAWNNTRSCAEKAGMGEDVQIITEPEAAGIYALKSLAQPLKLNDTFVMCDAGGGTVDLISYTVSAEGKNLTIEEAAQGRGDLCGSTFLNRIFEERLLNKFHGALLAEWKTDYHATAMAKFENDIKRKFDGNRHKNFTVAARNMKANRSVGISGGNLTITGTELHEIFELVIPKIIDLIQTQIRETRESGKHVQKILLAGGFGQSFYLLGRIEKAFPAIEVLQIDDGDTAIVRGAILRAMAEKAPEIPGVLNVGGRYSKTNFGALAWVKYNSADHAGCAPSKRRADGQKGGEIVEVMDWLIPKGELVRESNPTPYPFEWTCKVSAGWPQEVKVQLYKCDDPRPDFFNHQVQKFVDLKANLARIPPPKRKYIVQEGQNGVEYYNIPLEVAITCRSGSFKFILKHDGEPYDTFNQTMN